MTTALLVLLIVFMGVLIVKTERIGDNMDELTQEVAAIKAEVVAFRDAVVQKIADLEAALAANDQAALKAALDDLKATADGLNVPA